MFGHGLDFILMASPRRCGGCSSVVHDLGHHGGELPPPTPISPISRRPRNGAQRYVPVGVAFGRARCSGPKFGGIAGESDPRMPFWIAAACFLNAAYGWFVLPESLLPERRSAFSAAKANLPRLSRLPARPWRGRLAGGGPDHLEHRLLGDPDHFGALHRLPLRLTERRRRVMLAGHRHRQYRRAVGMVRPTASSAKRRLRTGLGFSIAAMLVYAFAWEGWMFLLGIVFQSAAGIMGTGSSGADVGGSAGPTRASSRARSPAPSASPGCSARSSSRRSSPGRWGRARSMACRARLLVSALFYLAALGVAWAATANAKRRRAPRRFSRRPAGSVRDDRGALARRASNASSPWARIRLRTIGRPRPVPRPWRRCRDGPARTVRTPAPDPRADAAAGVGCGWRRPRRLDRGGHRHAAAGAGEL